MHIFHRHRDVDGREQLEFSVANAVEPGTFDIDTMEDEQFAGITFFMKLPGPRDPLASLERMLTAGRRLAEGMNGDLKDEQHSVLTPQTMEHLRQRVQEFETPPARLPRGLSTLGDRRTVVGRPFVGAGLVGACLQAKGRQSRPAGFQRRCCCRR